MMKNKENTKLYRFPNKYVCNYFVTTEDAVIATIHEELVIFARNLQSRARN